MKKHLSLVASAAIICTTSVYADSSSINEAFKKGKVSGDISIHSQSWDNGTGEKDSGFITPSIGLNYETDSINGFSATIGFRANQEVSEKEAGDYEGEMVQEASATQAFIQYTNETVDIKLGRQEVDLEWMGDYHDGATVALKAIPDTTLVFGWSNRKAEIGADKHEKFTRFEDKDGKNTSAFVVDAKYEGVKGLVLNPYYYTVQDLTSFYGLRADYDTDMFGITGQYTTSSENATATKDGNIYNLELRTAILGLELAAGYISVDKDGIGNINALGDNANPTEELEDYVYASDTDTIYAVAAYEISRVGLLALYAVADNDTTNKKDKELTVGASYAFTESLSAEVLYTDLSLESDKDKDKLVANLVFEF